MVSGRSQAVNEFGERIEQILSQNPFYKVVIRTDFELCNPFNLLPKSVDSALTPPATILEQKAIVDLPDDLARA